MKAFNPADLVIWLDNDMLVVNKPSGLPTLVNGYNPEAPFLVGIMKTVFNPIWTVHRLDRETSGLIVFARTPTAHKSLNSQFEKRQAFKTYHALVTGDPSWVENTVNLPLRPDGDRKHRTVVDTRRGKPSSTYFRVMERFFDFALIEAIPRTGRTHQIRVHLAAVGIPVVADKLYGNGQPLQFSESENLIKGKKKREISLLKRLGLHSYSLTLLHPSSGSELNFAAPYPEDLANTLNYLHKNLARKRPVLTSY
jgi:RluA family pseudouridine synthase